MKVALQLWALLFGSTIGVLAQIPEKPNFTGTWILDLQRSRFGEMAQPKSLMIQIEHNEPQIRILSVKIVGKDEEREALELLTNGEDTSFDAKPAPCSANAHWDQWTSTRLVVDVIVTATRRAGGSLSAVRARF